MCDFVSCHKEGAYPVYKLSRERYTRKQESLDMVQFFALRLVFPTTFSNISVLLYSKRY